ncbi:glutamate racemase [Desulfobacula phenolica]|uniref:Glutamate racemase n=1 Tax=Desulfobacula phenolica TaxID=90732 RepID=A0A1H2IN83_9BACT|nr:glutamate racemase [Desulfobacula phenolica]SDU45619.1 glutamate racemase [Desulfobacula phenolica]
MNKQPIGIFDSGVGGLCVLKQIRERLPYESITYFADSGNCPYGSKAENEALNLARKNIEFLLELNCKLIVIACNTVTAVAIDCLRSEYKVPFIGMEPALKPAALQTRSKKIGILATENTLNGRLFKQTFDKYAHGLEVFIQPGHGLVELVETGSQNSEKARSLLKEYLLPMLEKGVDTIVLGCTHYPFLKEMIQTVTENSVTIVDPADAVASQTKRILIQYELISIACNDPQLQFYTTGEKTMAQKILFDTINSPYGLGFIEV